MSRSPGCRGPWAAFSSGTVEAHPTLEPQNIKGDKNMWRSPGCGGPWAAFSRRAVETHPTLEYHKIKGDKTYVEALGCGGPLGIYPACPILNPALGCSGLTPNHWAFKNLFWVGADTKMRSQYLPADDLATAPSNQHLSLIAMVLYL